MQKLTPLVEQKMLMIKWLYLTNYLVLRVGNFTQKLFELLETHLEPFLLQHRDEICSSVKVKK